VFLALLFVLTFPINAYASELTAEQASLQAAILTIRSRNENAIIEEIDGTLHIYFPMESNQDSNISLLSNDAVTIYAPDGGLWTNFKTPWYVAMDPNSTRPYGVVFLPTAQAESMYKMRYQEDAWDYIKSLGVVSSATSAVLDSAVKYLKTQFSIDLTKLQVFYLCVVTTVDLYKIANSQGFQTAYNNTAAHKIRIDYTTVNGWPANIYYSWTSAYVTNSPWEDFSPSFHSGIYDTSQL